MNSLEGNTPPLSLPPTTGANPAQKRPLEEESEQETKRQRLEEGTSRIYTSAADAMNVEKDSKVQELEKRVLQLEAQNQNYERLLQAAKNHVAATPSIPNNVMDIDEKAESPSKPNIAQTQTKTEATAKLAWDTWITFGKEEEALKQKHADEENKLKLFHLEKEKIFFCNLLKTKPLNLSRFIALLERNGHLLDMVRQIDWNDVPDPIVNHFLKHFFLATFCLWREIIEIVLHVDKDKYRKARPLKLEEGVWKSLVRKWNSLLRNYSSYIINFDASHVFITQQGLYKTNSARAENFQNLFLPTLLVSTAERLLLTNGVEPKTTEEDHVNNYKINQAMKYMGTVNPNPQTSINNWAEQCRVARMGEVDLVYETAGAIPLDAESYAAMKDAHSTFWDSWIVIHLQGSGFYEYVLLSRKDFLVNLDLFADYAPNKNELDMNLEKGYSVEDYVRFFKGMKYQDVSEYNLEETVKLLSLSIHHNQKEGIILACEKRLLALLGADNVEQIADRVPPDIAIRAPQLHTQIKELLWKKVLPRLDLETLNALSFVKALSFEQKNLMDSFEGSWLSLDDMKNLANHFGPNLKRMKLRGLITKEQIPLLKNFTALKELELEDLEYSVEMANTLKQMPNLDSLAFQKFKLVSTQKQPLIKKLRVGNKEIPNVEKLFSIFNNLTYLTIPLQMRGVNLYLVDL